MKKFLVFGIITLIFSYGLVYSHTVEMRGKFTVRLLEKLDKIVPNEKICVIVKMVGDADLSRFAPNEKALMVQHLKDFADRTERDLLNTLPKYGDKVSRVRPFFLVNDMAITATKDVIIEISKREDVEYLDEDYVYKIPPIEIKEGDDPESTEWGLRIIEATRVWSELGITGSGIVVSNMDTGVLNTHPALSARWRSTDGWYDGVNGRATPYDDHGHGTHTMGTITGRATVDTIGVAIGATWIASKACDAGGSCPTSAINGCYDWYATLAGRGTAPNVLSCSWGGGHGSTAFWIRVRRLQTLGIHQSYSIGNSGPGSSTCGTPGDFPCTIGVGATDSGDNIASFSSRGPSASGGNYDSTATYLDPQWATRSPTRVKPDLSAPGVNVRSSYNNGGYTTMSGTSMSCPHVAGAIALMLQKNNTLTDAQIWNIITTNIDRPSQGGTYPNYNYGWGRLNAYKAVSATPVANKPNLITDIITLRDPPPGNGNGKADPGETIIMKVSLKNTGSVGATNVNGVLRPPSPNPYITITDSTSAYGNIGPGGTAAGDSFIWRSAPSTPPGYVANFTLHITYQESLSGVDRNIPITIGTAAGTIIWGPKQRSGAGADTFLYGLGYDRVNNELLVTYWTGTRIYRYSSDSLLTQLGTIPAPGGANCSDIKYCAYDNTYWVLRNANDMIYKISRTGTVLRSFPIPAPANDYPVGLAWDNGTRRLYVSDRRALNQLPQYVVMLDTMGTLLQQWNHPLSANAGARCLDIDWLGPGGGSLLNVYTSFNSGGTQLDSVGLYELNRSSMALIQRILFQNSWNARGVAFDPRDGDYWIGIMQQPGVGKDYIVKIRGFYRPPFGVEEIPTPIGMPSEFALAQSYPNPAKGNAVIRFALPRDTKVMLNIYNISGQKIRTLVSGEEKAGFKSVTWDGRTDSGAKVPAGIYFYRIEAGGFTATRKVVVIR